MKKVKIGFISVIFFLIGFIACSFAQCPDPETIEKAPILRGVEVKALISQDKQTGIYTYSYSVKNGTDSDNTACIWWFEVDITFPIGGMSLSKEGLVDYPRYVSKDLPSILEPASVIPVAFPDLPRRTYPADIGEITIWDAGLTVDGAAHWGSALGGTDLHTKIAPGEELKGFIITTYGLPTIRDFKVEPKYIAEDEDLYKMGVSKEELYADAGKYLLLFYESIAFKAKTLGPTAPPADFKPIEFIDYIVNIKHEAFSLGWIKNKGIENSLDAKLENAKKKLQAGDIKTAKNILNAFLNELEAQKDKHLTTEAYGLLKYNVEYLIGRL